LIKHTLTASQTREVQQYSRLRRANFAPHTPLTSHLSVPAHASKTGQDSPQPHVLISRVHVNNISSRDLTSAVNLIISLFALSLQSFYSLPQHVLPTFACTMDIDDLLAEVAVDSTPRETRDLQELTRCWVAERVAPEILPWPSDLMDRVLERIRRQVCHGLWISPLPEFGGELGKWQLLMTQPDRNGRRSNRQHGPQDKFQVDHHPDGT
jgi:hypothetical protein